MSIAQRDAESALDTDDATHQIDQSTNRSVTSSEAYMETGISIDHHFRRRFVLLRTLGIYLGRKNDDGTYTFTIGRLITAYITWFVIHMAVFVGAEVWHSFRVTNDQKLTDVLASPIFIAVCVILPLLGSHSLNAITYALRENMNSIPTYRNFCKQEKTQAPNSLKNNKIWVKFRGAAFLTGGTISSILFLVPWISSLADSAVGIKEKLLEEIPVYLVDVIYQILPLLTTVFMISFLDYYTELYRDLKIRLLNLCAEWTPVALEDLRSQIEKVQRSFHDLYEGFLQYALTVNALTTTFFATMTTYRLTLGSYEIIYLVPALLGAVHILFIAKYSRDLMFEAKFLTIRTREEALEFRRTSEEKYSALRSVEALLNEFPPVVRAYGNVPFGYGIVPIIVVFLVVYAGLLDFVDDFYQVFERNTNKTIG
ncbi:uncharacterized protein [Macrobrachium rosenbergii]|uniref:uncharacterized protein n=1 Tax=Macrobrachium rosenbergii TaxID=79674 RepID=UPI0034D4C9B4